MRKEHETTDLQALYAFHKPSLRTQACASVKDSIFNKTFFAFAKTGLVQCSAIKQSFDGKGVIVRLFNPSNQDGSVEFSSQDGYRVFTCKLDESEAVEIRDAKIKISAKKIVTLKITDKAI
jgi:alpha-mannosidase